MFFVAAPAPVADTPAAISIEGEWRIHVSKGVLRIGRAVVHVRQDATVSVQPPTTVSVRDERHDALPVFNPNTAGWTKGARLAAVVTCETTGPDLLRPSTLVVKSGPDGASAYVRGTDYDVDDRWGTVGRLNGGIGEATPVWVDYDAGLNRIDSLVVDRRGRVALRAGGPHNSLPTPPAVEAGETRIANVWVPAGVEALSEENLFPITSTGYVPPKTARPPAERLLPKTWRILNEGGTLNVLAWGDSVTAGGQASDAAHQYQSRFAAMLRERFPTAKVVLTTAGWGGRNSDSFLNEPAGAEFNFERAVIDRKPDLVVMEFVNDAWMTPEVVEQKYSYLLKRFQEIGAEWAIVTPHFVWQEWMGSKTVKIESDPRPYVAGVRAFCAKHSIALADTSLRYGHLVKQGIPYITLMANCLNHPNDYGHEMFALSLMELFGGPAATRK